MVASGSKPSTVGGNKNRTGGNQVAVAEGIDGMAAPAKAPVERALRPPVGVKLAYCFGQAVESGYLGINAFIFFYYTAVLGLSGSLVGAALALSMCLDAIADPLIGSWSDNTRSRLGRRLPAILQVDTGMSRLGLSPRELATVVDDPGRLDGVELLYVMSHLACSEQQSHALNADQLARFKAARAMLPAAPASFANSSGIFLSPDYHFDLARPGAALYGIAPVAGQPNPMRPVIRLQGKVIQLRDIDAGAVVGYGATWRAPTARRIATVSVGYADGFLRGLSNHSLAYFGDTPLALVGIVSMDTITLDVSDVPDDQLQPGGLVELIGDRHPVDALAEEAGTIGYEILTSLGGRYFRDYLGA